MNTGVDRLGFLIHDAARLIRKRFERRGAKYGLSAAQWRLLFRVAKEEGLPQARLSELLEIEPISVSRLLDRMEASGWVKRCQSPEDRRVRTVFPTDKARAAFADIRSIAAGVYDEALDGLDQDQRAALIVALERIATNLAEPEAGAGDEAAPLRRSAN